MQFITRWLLSLLTLIALTLCWSGVSLATENPQVSPGIEVAEECIGVLDVALLAQTAAMLFGQMENEKALDSNTFSNIQ